MKTKKVFNKEEIEEMVKRKLNPISYMRGWYQHLFPPKTRFLNAQKLACKVILKSGLPKNSPVYKQARETLSRMTN